MRMGSCYRRRSWILHKPVPVQSPIAKVVQWTNRATEPADRWLKSALTHTHVVISQTGPCFLEPCRCASSDTRSGYLNPKEISPSLSFPTYHSKPVNRIILLGHTARNI
ncbi:hypothetical protein TWF217_004887 [Orbilia oligospora]|nr:hypothetical protein TWF128_005107 [Orbilia oligospora]KAF3260310.1 hypothetical protein TWF217_004887 [Orbilia oligospora]